MRRKYIKGKARLKRMEADSTERRRGKKTAGRVGPYRMSLQAAPSGCPVPSALPLTLQEERLRHDVQRRRRLSSNSAAGISGPRTG